MHSINAGDISKLLAAKHVNAVYVPQCKTGASDRGMQIMDGWAMDKSWAHPLVTAYEIKVSRNDFLQDNKWPGYLKYCNAFYFVCPADLIKVDELPADVGLMWVSKTGTRVYTKRKAVYRKVDIPESVFRYVLMCRSVISREQSDSRDKEYWAQWLVEKQMDHTFGWRVSKSIRQTVDQRIDAVERENRRLVDLMDKYKDLEHVIRSLGFDVHDVRSFNFRDRLAEKLQDIKLGVDHDLVKYLKHIGSDIARALAVLDKPVLDVAGQLKDTNANG